MAEQKASGFSWPLVALGLFVTGAGVYFGLVGVQTVPAPSRVNGPIWISLFVALVFFAGGVAVIVSGVTGAYDRSGELPADTPKPVAIVYWLAGLLMASGLAGLASWVAFGAGTRHFSMSGLIGGSVGETIGRTVFGFGAVITWLLVVWMARSGAKKIFGKKN